VDERLGQLAEGDLAVRDEDGAGEPALGGVRAAEALVLPVLAQMTACDPASRALLMAIVMPRSLKDPVGLAPSTLSHTFAPVASERWQA
jgi:L-asparaginase II